MSLSFPHPRAALVALPLVALVACEPSATDTTNTGDDTADTSDTGDTDTGDTGGGGVTHYTLVGTTTDYTVGALVTISDEGALTDSVLPVSSDAAVRAIGDHVYVMNRSSENTVQRFDRLDFSAPALEFSTGDGSNPHDVAECGGAIVVANYATDALAVYDPATGLQTGSVDLSAYSDSDGSPEPDSLYVAPNGALYVALNQLESYVSADGSGTIAKIDCGSWQVVDAVDVGPNPMMAPLASDPDVLAVTGGNYYNADYSGPELDGALGYLDTTSDTWTVTDLTEASVGRNIGAIASTADGHLLTSLDDGYTWSLYCIAPDGSATELDIGEAYIGAMQATPDGTIWAAVGAGYGAGTPPTTGFTPVNPVDCTVGAPVTPALGASSITAVIQP